MSVNVVEGLALLETVGEDGVHFSELSLRRIDALSGLLESLTVIFVCDNRSIDKLPQDAGMTSVATVTDIGSLQMMNTPFLFELGATSIASRAGTASPKAIRSVHAYLALVTLRTMNTAVEGHSSGADILFTPTRLDLP